MKPLVHAVAFLSVAVVLSACSKQDDPPPPTSHARATPAATPARQTLLGDTVQVSHKANDAFRAIGDYLKKEDPKLGDKLEHATDKIGRDKGKWREKLQQKQKELQPQIEELKKQLVQLDGNTRDTMDRLARELSSLETQSNDADKKLSEIETATTEAWTTLKQQLKFDDSHEQDTPPPRGVRNSPPHTTTELPR